MARMSTPLSRLRAHDQDGPVSQLEAHEVALHKVFSSDYDFVIPDYQRPYAWRVENAKQLLEDLEDALVRGDGERYFLGLLAGGSGRMAIVPVESKRRMLGDSRACSSPYM